VIEILVQYKIQLIISNIFIIIVPYYEYYDTDTVAVLLLCFIFSLLKGHAVCGIYFSLCEDGTRRHRRTDCVYEKKELILFEIK
jgi:hypothetical protein